jgi:hypothetical protein
MRPEWALVMGVCQSHTSFVDGGDEARQQGESLAKFGEDDELAVEGL